MRQERSRGKDAGTGISASSRMGVRSTTSTLEERNSASSTSWVMKRMVLLCRCHWSSSHSCMEIRVRKSRAEKGSSSSSRSQPVSMVRAKAARCRIPPESSSGILLPQPASPTSASAASARSRRSARVSSPWISKGSATFSPTVRQGNSRSFWGI